jgi:hypothetical protein
MRSLNSGIHNINNHKRQHYIGRKILIHLKKKTIDINPLFSESLKAEILKHNNQIYLLSKTISNL